MELLEVFLNYKERRFVIEEPAEDEGQFSDRGTDGIEWIPISIDTTTTNGYSLEIDFIPKSNTNVYLVTVRYSDGDTFGRTEGYWDIIKVCKTMKEAEKIEQGIRDQTYIMPGGYKPWDGYFASFDDVQIDSIPVM